MHERVYHSQLIPHGKIGKLGSPPLPKINKLIFNLFKMEHFKVYESQTKLTPYADSLNQLVGEGGSFRPASRRNFLSDKSVALVASLAPDKDGKVATAIVVVAEEISNMLRSKQIKLEQLGAFPISEFDTGSSDPMLLLTYPQDGSNSNVPAVVVTKDSLKAKSVPKRQETFDWKSVMSY